MRTFTTVNETTLITTIKCCKKRLIYIAPGLTKLIADTIAEILSEQKVRAVTVIIDTDPEVCRFGYGTVDGLKRLHEIAEEFHIGIRYQQGLRVGLIICDDVVIAYTPTPLLIEAGSEFDDKPNAVFLGNNPLQQFLSACAAEVETTDDIPVPTQAEIGTQSISPQMMKESIEELERIPPKPYDISRIERVFSSKLQYVEFEVKGYKLSSRKVQIPNDLLVGNDDKLEKRLFNSFKILEGKEVLKIEIEDADPKTNITYVNSDGSPRKITYTEKQIELDRKKIYDDFLISISGHGQLISRARRDAFDKRLTWFRNRIFNFKEGIQKVLDKEIKKSVDNLAEALLPGIKKNTPDRLLKMFDAAPSDKELLEAIKAELNKTFGRIDQFFTPEVKIIFKDLTYETIQDQNFRDQLEKLYKKGGVSSMNDLFSEHDVAPEA